MDTFYFIKIQSIKMVCPMCKRRQNEFICCFCHKWMCEDCVYVMSLSTVFCSRDCCRKWDIRYYGLKKPKKKRRKRKKRRNTQECKLPSIRSLPDSLMIKTYKIGTVKHVPKARKKIQHQHDFYRPLPSISSLPSLLCVKKCKIQNKY